MAVHKKLYEYVMEIMQEMDECRRLMTPTWQEIDSLIKPLSILEMYSINHPIQNRIVPKLHRYDLKNTMGCLFANRLPAGIQSHSTNKALKWLEMKPEEKLEGLTPVRTQQLFHNLALQILDLFENSNFYSECFNLYYQAAVHGTGLCEIVPNDDHRKLISLRHLPTGTFWIRQNREKMVDVVGTIHVMKKWAAMKELDGKAKAGNENCSMLTICFRDYDKDPSLKKITDGDGDYVYIKMLVGETSAPMLVERKKRDPFIKFRWIVEDYRMPYSLSFPAVNAMGNLKRIKNQTEMIDHGLMQKTAPAMVAPNDMEMAIKKTGLAPGSMTYYTSENPTKEVVKNAMQINFQVNEMDMDREKEIETLKQHFNLDLFQHFIDLTNRRTATEVQLHQSQLVSLFGSPNENIEEGILVPAIDAGLNRLVEIGKISSDIPKHFKANPVFDTLINQSLKAISVEAMERFLMNIKEIDQGQLLRDTTKLGALVKNYGTHLGLNPALFRTEQETENREQQRIQNDREALNVQSQERLSKAGLNDQKVQEIQQKINQ